MHNVRKGEKKTKSFSLSSTDDELFSRGGKEHSTDDHFYKENLTGDQLRFAEKILLTTTKKKILNKVDCWRSKNKVHTRKRLKRSLILMRQYKTCAHFVVEVSPCFKELNDC